MTASIIARPQHDDRAARTGWVCVMTKLERLYTYQRQSPWLDNLTRPYLRDGT